MRNNQPIKPQCALIERAIQRMMAATTLQQHSDDSKEQFAEAVATSPFILAQNVQRAFARNKWRKRRQQRSLMTNVGASQHMDERDDDISETASLHTSSSSSSLSSSTMTNDRCSSFAHVRDQLCFILPILLAQYMLTLLIARIGDLSYRGGIGWRHPTSIFRTIFVPETLASSVTALLVLYKTSITVKNDQR